MAHLKSTLQQFLPPFSFSFYFPHSPHLVLFLYLPSHFLCSSLYLCLGNEVHFILPFTALPLGNVKFTPKSFLPLSLIAFDTILA